MKNLFESRSEIIPLVLRQPSTLLWSHLGPISLLILLNGLFFWILFSELEPEMLWKWIVSMTAQVVLCGGAFWCARRAKWNHSEVPVIYALALLIGICAYLGLVVSWTGWDAEMIPEAESRWILDPGQWLGLQFTFMMPALFHNAIRIACIPVRFREVNDLAASIMGVVVIPFGLYFLSTVTGGFGFFGGAMLFFLAGATLVMMLLVLRALSLIFLTGTKTAKGQIGLTILFSLLLPVGGLALNRSVPFPADFQMEGVYILTFINGLVMLFSLQPCQERYPLLLWILQWALLPFTLYFFLVFLPWLPLSLLAMIALGGGFLILAPTALMLLHGIRLHQTASVMSQRHPRYLRWVPAILAFLLLPGTFVGRAIQDRIVLAKAIGHVFEPRSTLPRHFTESRDVVRRSLRNLVNHYEGNYIPYLSNMYDALVFQGLTLPQRKIEILHQALLGEPPPEIHPGSWSFTSTRSRNRMRNRRGQPPPTDAVLTKVEWDVVPGDGVVHATATLTLHNPTQLQSEFVQRIHLPPGVWVSGYFLDVEGVRKPGRLTERKTATWVYKTIRDATRRDPGLLVYDGPDHVELRVFPLEADQTRTTGITFTMPHLPNLDMDINGSSMPIPEAPKPAGALTASGAMGLPTQDLNPAWAVKRKPLLYLMIDRSVTGPEDVTHAVESALNPIQETWGKDIAGARVVYINHNVAIAEGASVTPQSASSISPILPREGGWIAEPALIAMFEDHEQLLLQGKASATTFPLPVWVKGSTEPVSNGLTLSPWTAPNPEWHHPPPQDLTTWKPSPKPVWIFRTPTSVVATGTDVNFVHMFDEKESFDVERFDPDSESFLPFQVPSRRSEAYQNYANAWHAYLKHETSGSLSLRDAVRISRETSVLLPVTAYIVLENEAQEKMMKLKEQQKLSGQDALDFMDTPEPGTFALGLFAIALAWLHTRSQKGKKVTHPNRLHEPGDPV